MTYCILSLRYQSSLYEICSLAIWNIWNFIFLFNEDGLALKVAEEIRFQWLVPYKPVACKKSIFAEHFSIL